MHHPQKRPERGDTDMLRFAVVVPMYNEEAGARHCVEVVTAALAPLGPAARLIVVEDGGRDATGSILEELHRAGKPFTLIRHPGNRGYGAALRTGALEAHRQGRGYVLFMDSDLTNPPEHIARFVPFMHQGIDVIKGCRYCAQGKVDGVPWRRYIISRLGNLLAEHLFGVGIKDATNGFRCIKTEIFLAMPLMENRFPIISEEMFWAKKLGCTFANVPTRLTNRSAEQRATSFSYRPSTFYGYLRYAVRAAFLPRVQRAALPILPANPERWAA